MNKIYKNDEKMGWQENEEHFIELFARSSQVGEHVAQNLHTLISIIFLRLLKVEFVNDQI